MAENFVFQQTGTELQNIINSVAEFDTTPTADSVRPVTSGGVKAAIDAVETDTETALGGKADKVDGATNGNFAGLDSDGNITDSGNKAADFATAAQGALADAAAPQSTTYTKTEVDNIASEKADKVDGATSGNFAGLDANGNLTDSGSKAEDFATAAQGALADAAAPQSTTYTKTEVDTLLNAKQDTLTIDTALSNTSTNPVQNKVVHAAIAATSNAVMNMAGSSSGSMTLIQAGNNESATAYMNLQSATVTISGNGGGVAIDSDGVKITAGNSGLPNAKAMYNGVEIATVSDIPSVNNATLTIQKEGANVGTFTANASTAATVNIVETDPVFGASAAAGITASDIEEWDGKQEALVSGTNIKTINNESLLGSGNITIEGGGGSDEAVLYTEQTLTDAQKTQARTNIGAQAALTFDSTPTASSTNPVTSGGVYTALSGKEDAISDLATIRSGATAGATAYQKPSTGIPASDLASAVQTSLAAADAAAPQSTTYTKTETDTLLDDYAKKDGAYEGLLAGTAMNLVDTSGDADLREFTFDTAGGDADIATGSALIKTMRGNTLVWNQVMQANIGATFNVTGSYINLNSTLKMGIRPTVGHKYYTKNTITYNSGSATIESLYIVWAQTAHTANTAEIITYVELQPSDDNQVRVLSPAVSDNTYSGTISIIEVDLTQMFGAGNEPATAAEFESMFPLDCYDYNVGELVSFTGDTLKTVGFNAFDPTTGTADLIGGNEYMLEGTYTSFSYTTINGNSETITLASDGSFTPNENGTLTIVGGNDTDTCVHLTWSGTQNGTYEAYEEHEKDISFYKSLTDGNNNTLFPYGLLSAGSVYDEVTGTKAIKRVGAQTISGSSGDTITLDGCSTSASEFKCASDIGTLSGGVLTLTADASNTLVFYELAEPVEVTYDEVNMGYSVNDWGTEQILPANGTEPTTSPALLDVVYGVNAVDTLKNLPRNYLAQDDLDRLLTAMGTALGFSYTKTWNESTGQWSFTITSNG